MRKLGFGFGTKVVGGTPTPSPTPAPSWSVNPSISGTFLIGGTLTGADGTISNGTVSTRQWRRDGVDISGATGSTYVLVAADIGAAITFRVTATGAGGSASATSASVSYNPATLFAASEQGGWYDPSDIATLWQDTAGTVPVTATGQLVARIDDKSGRGNHLIQATSAQRPSYQLDGARGYLLFDGTDDGMATSGNVNFSTTDNVTAIAGIYKNSDAGAACVVELTTSAFSTNGGFTIRAPQIDNATVMFASRGTTYAEAISPLTYPAPLTAVVSGIADISSLRCLLRYNSSQIASNTNTQGTGNFANAPIFVGRRAGSSLPFNGRIYGLLIRGVESTGSTLTTAEAWMNSRTGAY